MTDLIPPQPPINIPPVPSGSDPIGVPIVPPHKKFPLFLMLLIPVLVVAAVISIYVLLQARTMYQQAVVTPAPSPQASVDPMADWQTYTNIKYGYTIKVPKDWKLSSSEPGPGEIPLNNSSRGLVMYPSSYSNSANAKVNISLETDGIENLSYQNYEQWLKATEVPFFTVIKKEQIDFHGADARFLIGNYDGYGYAASLTTRSFPSLDKKIYFNIITTEPTEENLAPNVVDQILSTFKFEPIIQNKDLENTIKDLVFDYGKSHGISSKDQIIIKILKIDGDYAYGTTSFVESVEGSGNVWYATYLDGHWTQIWAGQEPPTCISLSDWRYPKDFFECTQ